jgi:hypothetical protein
MAIDRALIIVMALAVVAIVLMIPGQAIGQFNSVLKAVLTPKDDPEPVRSYPVMRSGCFLGVRHRFEM